MDPPQISYATSNSILVINPNGKIRQLFVPIRVQVLSTTSILVKNSWVFVEEIQENDVYKLIYRITDH
jgi:hypothetical protein